MEDRVTTSWKRLSDEAWNTSDSSSARRAPTLLAAEKEAQLQAWEGEGGHTALSRRPVQILIVDNDMGAADSLENMLHASGYSETRVAYSGHAAMAIAVEFKPDIVLLDLSLLDMTGYELAKSLREQAQSRDLRLIALTYSAEHLAREQARVAGFERYLLKPVAAADLSALMDRPVQ
jgi:CheY-like chemotaxis protein